MEPGGNGTIGQAMEGEEMGFDWEEGLIGSAMHAVTPGMAGYTCLLFFIPRSYRNILLVSQITASVFHQCLISSCLTCNS